MEKDKEELEEAMETFGFDPAMQSDIKKIGAGVMCLGDTTFKEAKVDGEAGSEPDDKGKPALEKACEYLFGW